MTKLQFLFALPAPSVQNFLHDKQQQGVLVADLSQFFPAAYFNLAESDYRQKQEESLTEALQALQILIADVEQDCATNQQKYFADQQRNPAEQQWHPMEQQKNSAEEQGAGTEYLIHIPNILVRQRGADLKVLIESSISKIPGEILFLNQDISQLVLENELFGAKNSLVLPRKIVREQLNELEKYLENFNYVILPSIS